MQRTGWQPALFWAGMIALIGFRLLLTSDVSTQINYAPQDDSLYVTRAFQFLRGEAFGPYDPRILVKYPGLTFWLATTRTLGLPFLLTVNALYIGAGLYLARAFLLGGINRWLVLASFGLFLFNPITLGYEWIRVIREPLGTGLFILMAGAIAHMCIVVAQGRPAWAHLAVFAPAFAFSLFLREDDRMLLALAAILAVALWLLLARRRPVSRGLLVFVLVAVAGPLALGKAHEYAWRAFAERHYGLALFHEFSDGEFPRLLAAIRSVQTAKDNRMVMAPQEALALLAKEVPSFRPVADRIPKPGNASESCQQHGVCSEWSNGWMPFLIKEEAFRAGLTPTLAAAQQYFLRVRTEIEQACAEKRLRCEGHGQGLVPPMELRWTRAYVLEAWRLVKMALAPDNNRFYAVPVVFDVPIELGRVYQAITLADYYDTQYQAAIGERPKGRPYANPVAWLRVALVGPYQALGMALILAAAAALFARLYFVQHIPPSPLMLGLGVVGAYLLVRLAALAYVAVYFGAFSGRMVFATYAFAMLCALPVLADSVGVLWLAKKAVPR
jgi:hypothetical protein